MMIPQARGAQMADPAPSRAAMQYPDAASQRSGLRLSEIGAIHQFRLEIGRQFPVQA
jgi:hypothetical protein